jgi:hypothetical protein
MTPHLAPAEAQLSLTRLQILLGVVLVTAAFAAEAAPKNAPATKPVIVGLIDMQDIAWHNTDDGQPVFTLDYVNTFPGLFGGIVYNGTWAEMQPEQGGALSTARLDAALKQVNQYNIAHPATPLGVKLRIYSGNQAPPWAKALAGGPLTIQRNAQGCPSGDCPITIGVVWSPEYIAAWRAFQAALAARYDRKKLIRSVAITSCSMETDEPFVMPVGQPIPEGYTDKAGEACLRGAVEDYASWTQTVIDYTINPFLKIEKGGTDFHFSLAIMNACRAGLDVRCELGNHALSSAMAQGIAKTITAISNRGAPIHYQTEGPAQTGFSWKATIRLARRKHAAAVELWPEAKFGGFMSLTARQMQTLFNLFNGADAKRL